MEARAKLFGHPIHQMLIVFPLGLLATSLFFDIAYLITNRSELARVAYWMIFAGMRSRDSTESAKLDTLTTGGPAKVQGRSRKRFDGR